MTAVQDTCARYQREVAIGGDPAEIVAGLAAVYNVNRPAIWRRLRSGGALPPYKSGTPHKKHKRRTAADCEHDRQTQPRVDRDPCQRCGVRHDIGCHHSRAPVGMSF